MQRTLVARAAIATAAAVVAAGGSVLLGGVAMAGGHGGWGGANHNNDGGHGGRGGHTTISCTFHGPVTVGNHSDDGTKLSQCGAVGTSNGAHGGPGY